jgi:hypothetical protein
VLPGEGYRTPQGGCERCVWSNGGMVISGGKLEKLDDKPAPVPFRPSKPSHEAHGIESTLRSDRSQSLTARSPNLKANIGNNNNNNNNNKYTNNIIHGKLLPGRRVTDSIWVHSSVFHNCTNYVVLNKSV